MARQADRFSRQFRWCWRATQPKDPRLPVWLISLSICYVIHEVSEIRFSAPGEVPWLALAILNPPQIKVVLEVGIIKVNLDKLALAFIHAGN